MPNFRKKLVIIEAIHYRGEQDKHLVREFVTTPIDEVGVGPDGHRGLHVETPEGWLHVSPGDWIIKGVHSGSFYPCKPDVFEAAYEAVEDPQTGGVDA